MNATLGLQNGKRLVIHAFLSKGRYKSVGFFKLILWALVALVTFVSASRVAAVVTNFGAPMDLYQRIPSDAEGALCLGKEWYRYPSSFFIPSTLRTRFIKSEFDGILPGSFGEGKLLSGTWQIPEHMNNANREELSRYVLICLNFC